VRWDTANGKNIRPVALHADGWRISAMPEPRPLYELTELASAKRVVVVEGEKAADAARFIRLTATTSSGGAQAASKTDWGPLAGKEVWLFPDNDAAGKKYVEMVVTILSKLTPAPVMRIIELPGLPEGGDIFDWIQAQNKLRGGDDLREEIEALAQAAPNVDTASVWSEIEPFDELCLPEFPTHVLPDRLRQWVEAESHATQTPADLAGLLSLAVCSASIARRVVVEPREGWREPVNLYVAVLLEPGNRKSAVFSDAMRPLRELETELIEAARPTVARAQSERRQKEHKLQKLEKLAAEKGDLDAQRDGGNLAEELAKQTEPVLPRLIADDATSEKLGMLLAEQGGRMASMSPEGGVFDLMAGLYSKSGIPQFGVYLMGHNGDDLTTDRVSRKSICVARPALTCAYAMQPAVIQGLAENVAFRGRGLLARFLYAAPQSWIGRREIAPVPVSDAARAAYRHVVRALAELQGEQVLRLTVDASAMLQAWEAEIENMLSDGGEMETIRDWGSKLTGATVRLAAVLHCIERGPTGLVEEKTIAAAIELARYLVPHADAVLNMMQAKEDSGDADACYVLRWIERHSRREFTKTEVQHHGKQRFPKADDIDPALDELNRRGYIRPRRTDVTGPGRPRSPTFEVNPAVFLEPNDENRSHNSPNSVAESDSDNSGNIGSASEQTETIKRVKVLI
jgi:hypothetical protein